MPGYLSIVGSSGTHDAKVEHGLPTVAIGERVNAAGRKKMLDALQAGDFGLVR
jgi:cobalamin-dependent methionine synthase I